MDNLGQNPEAQSDQIGDKNLLKTRVRETLAKLSDEQLSQFYHATMTPDPSARQRFVSREWFPIVETLFGDGEDLNEEVRGTVFNIAADRLHNNILFPVAPDTGPFCIHNRQHKEGEDDKGHTHSDANQ